MIFCLYPQKAVTLHNRPFNLQNNSFSVFRCHKRVKDPRADENNVALLKKNSYRFYDKDKEVCSKHNKTLDEVGSWKRTEMQLRDDKAHVFAMTFKDRPLELGELAFGLLANNLRFVVPNRNESNKSRWKTCRFWERFLGAVEVLKLQVPKLHNSLEETQQWLTEGGVISAVKSFYFLEEHDALGGLEKVGTMLDRARYSSSLSSKLTAHLQRIDRTDLIPYIQYDTKHGKGGI